MKEALDLSMVPYGRQQQMGDDKSESGNEIDIKPIDKNNRPRFMMAEPAVEPVVTTAIKTGGKLQVRYRECMRNHAASIGGHANDGCGEFMQAGGVEGGLRCAACGCHRNFHRKEVQGGGGVGGGGCVDHHLLHPPPPPQQQQPLIYNTNPRWEKKKIQMGGGFPSLSSLALPQHHFHHRSSSTTNINGTGLFGTLDHNNNNNNNQMMNEDRRSETPEERGGGGLSVRSSSKRFRTKFTQEQKEKMLEFAERLGWRIQKHDDVALSQFCLEVGVKRQVLKVWMHNNKNTFRKPRENFNGTSSSPPPPPPPPAVQLESPPSSPPPSSINGV